MEKQDKPKTRRDEQRRKYSEIDKKGKDKLVRSPGENGGGQDTQKDLHLRTGRDEAKGKTQGRMERESRRRSSSAGSEKMDRVGDGQKKKGRILFDRPKPTAGCSANGRRFTR